MSKTKIVATIGPASESVEMLADLLNAGMNIMRLNFSHGDFPEHQARIDNLKTATKETGIETHVLQDLGGPKIRIGDFDEEHVVLVPGAEFILTTEKMKGNHTKVYINYPLLPTEAKAGDMIFLNDGKQKLQVKSIEANDVVCTVLVGGEMKGRRGVNLPDSDLSIKSVTDKDVHDLEFGITNNVDYMALSFVRHGSDITELRDILNARGCKAKIVAKIETPQAIAHIDEIIRLSDAIMVARGDLAVEVPFETVPRLQKMIVKKCNDAGKFVIVATQMMESMIHHSVPTRAEVSDVANAVWDGADAVMTSAETANGKYPLETIVAMTKVVEETEKGE
jgi:pyruvate kinase